MDRPDSMGGEDPYPEVRVPESHPVWLAAAWIADHVAHPESLLLLIAGIGALGWFGVTGLLAKAKAEDARAREEVPAGDDLL